MHRIRPMLEGVGWRFRGFGDPRKATGKRQESDRTCKTPMFLITKAHRALFVQACTLLAANGRSESTTRHDSTKARSPAFRPVFTRSGFRCSAKDVRRSGITSRLLNHVPPGTILVPVSLSSWRCRGIWYSAGISQSRSPSVFAGWRGFSRPFRDRAGFCP